MTGQRSGEGSVIDLVRWREAESVAEVFAGLLMPLSFVIGVRPAVRDGRVGIVVQVAASADRLREVVPQRVNGFRLSIEIVEIAGAR